MDTYVKRFHEKAMACYNSMVEDVLVEVGLHGVIEDYRIYPRVYLSFLSMLLVVASFTNESRMT